MTADNLVAMLGTYSGLITASLAGAALIARFGDITEIDVPMRSVCWRADRTRAVG
jgi:hypothetical protein